MASVYHTAQFTYAPPKLERGYYPYREPKPPYVGAPDWQCSVFYYWYEYLRRHDGYAECCESGGLGEWAELYEDFGNVHRGDFFSWWHSHYSLFMEPNPAFLVHKKQLREGQAISRNPFVEYVQLDLRFSETDIIRRVRHLLRVQKERTAYRFEKQLEQTGGDTSKAKQIKKRRQVISHARYKVVTRPILPTLHQHLLAWDARKQNPDASDADLFDIAGLEMKLPYTLEEIADLKADGLSVCDLVDANRRAKALAVQRHLRIAKQYIDNVVLGEFPKRDRR